MKEPRLRLLVLSPTPKAMRVAHILQPVYQDRVTLNREGEITLNWVGTNQSAANHS